MSQFSCAYLTFDCINIFKFGGDQLLDSHPSTEKELDGDHIPLGFDRIDQLPKLVDIDEFCNGHYRYVALHSICDFRYSPYSEVEY